MSYLEPSVIGSIGSFLFGLGFVALGVAARWRGRLRHRQGAAVLASGAIAIGCALIVLSMAFVARPL